MILMGAAWQNGLIPLSQDPIARAIELNGASIDQNKRAFLVGRLAAANSAVLKMPKNQFRSLLLLVDEELHGRAQRVSKRKTIPVALSCMSKRSKTRRKRSAKTSTRSQSQNHCSS
jgi:hypothetical protein